MEKQKLWAWVDVETTGLDETEDLILEVAIVMTDVELNEVGHIELVIPHENWEEIACEKVREMHARSGLAAVLQKHIAQGGLVELRHRHAAELFDFMDHFTNGSLYSKTPPEMCGATVHFDRKFLKYHYPGLEKLFHYRNIDVSSLRTVNAAWAPDGPQFTKAGYHRAMADIRESIEELKFYRKIGWGFGR